MEVAININASESQLLTWITLNDNACGSPLLMPQLAMVGGGRDERAAHC